MVKRLTEFQQKIIVAALLTYDTGPSITLESIAKILKKLDIPQHFTKIVREEGYLCK